MMIKVVSIYTRMNVYGGAQKVLMNIHEGLKGRSFKCLITSFDSWEALHDTYKNDIKDDEYFKFSLRYFLKVKKNETMVVLSHHRKTTSYLIGLRCLVGEGLKVIHIAHNEFHTNRTWTFFPKTIVAVSGAVKKNLVEYFKVDQKKVKVIHNGLKDFFPFTKNAKTEENNQDVIPILYPARINHVKQQVELVKQLSGKIPENIKITFVGDGPDYPTLKEMLIKHPSFRAIGFCDQMHTLYPAYKYVMLFSLHEGLPLSLIESSMCRTPVICNSVGGNEEIISDEQNGFIRNGFESLIGLLNELNTLMPDAYENMCYQARKTYLEKFEYSQMINKYEEIIKEQFAK